MTDSSKPLSKPRIAGLLVAILFLLGACGVALAAQSAKRGAEPAATPTPEPVAVAEPTETAELSQGPPAEGPAVESEPAAVAEPTEAQRPRKKRRKPAVVAQPPVDQKLAPFVGLSTWIDLYDVELTAEQQVDIAARAGVQAIYVQSGKFDSKPIEHPDRLATIIEGAHDHGMRVMVWYVPDFVDLQRDYERSQRAIAFTTPRGDRADAFGLDIEVEDLPNPRRRSKRLLELSAALRQWTGPDYPMAAVVLPPLQLDLRADWWPDFPYAELRNHYDVFIPMSYSSFRGTDARTTYRWNLGNVVEMRRRAGDPALPVHLAGGIADNMPNLDAFLRAVADADVLGAGLYDLHTTRPEDWATLQRLRVEPPG